MKIAVAFEKPVYKDQTNPANLGKIIAPNDTVTVAVRNAGGTETAQDLVVTDVWHGGTTIQFDTPVDDPNVGATEKGLTLRAEDIVRVHTKHQYHCPVAATYQVVIPQGTNPTVDLASITSIVFGGAPRAIGVSETGTPASNFTQQFVTDLEGQLNTVLNGHGYARVTGGGTTSITITITGLTLVPGTIVGTGLGTIPAWTVVGG